MRAAPPILEYAPETTELALLGDAVAVLPSDRMARSEREYRSLYIGAMKLLDLAQEAFAGGWRPGESFPYQQLVWNYGTTWSAREARAFALGLRRFVGEIASDPLALIARPKDGRLSPNFVDPAFRRPSHAGARVDNLMVRECYEVIGLFLEAAGAKQGFLVRLSRRPDNEREEPVQYIAELSEIQPSDLDP